MKIQLLKLPEINIYNKLIKNLIFSFTCIYLYQPKHLHCKLTPSHTHIFNYCKILKQIFSWCYTYFLSYTMESFKFTWIAVVFFVWDVISWVHHFFSFSKNNSFNNFFPSRMYFCRGGLPSNITKIEPLQILVHWLKYTFQCACLIQDIISFS